MDRKEQLNTMLQSIINGKEEEAAVTMHDYFVAKTREVAGIGSSTVEDFDEDLAALDTGEVEQE